MMQQPLPLGNVDDVTIRNALAAVGWNTPAPPENVPVLPWAIPVVVLGGAIVPTTYVLKDGDSGAALAAGTYRQIAVVPSGKQWRLVRVSMACQGEGGFPAINNASASLPAILSTTASTTNYDIRTVYPLPTETNPGEPMAILPPGASVGIVGGSGGGTTATRGTFFIEETDVPGQ